MEITFYGHSCFLIKTGATSLLIDPFITGNALAAHIDVNSITCDFILLTHGHGDHVADAEQIAANNQATIIANYEVATWFAEKGIESHGLNHGGWWVFPDGRVKFVNAVHSSVLPDGSYGGNPGGFVIEGDKTLYISGDTALHMDMKLIPLTCKPLDAAILCIGDNFTMGVDDAVLAAGFINCDRIIGAHYDTFEPIVVNHTEAKNKFESNDLELIMLEIGKSVTI